MREVIKDLELLIAEKGLQGILLFSPENLFYLTGYRGEEGGLLLEEGRGTLLVDGRYFTQAKEEAEGVEVGLLKSWARGIAEELRSRSLKRVGVEAHSLTLRQYQRLSEEAQGVEFVPIGEELEGLRARKGPDEVEAIKEAIAISERALKEVLSLLKPGVREMEVALELEFRMRRAGSEGVPFPPIVASGPRAALPHATPTEKRIGAGEPVIVDFGARHNRYCSDETRTFLVGGDGGEFEKIYQIVKEAQERAIERIRVGVPLSEVDRAARERIEAAGFGPHFSHGTGHGVGIAVHEWPTVSSESSQVAEEGMVITIEPAIYLPEWGGVRIEDMVLITPSGAEVLTTAPKDLTDIILR